MSTRSFSPALANIAGTLLAAALIAALFSGQAHAGGPFLSCTSDGDCEDAQGCTGTESCDPLLFVCLQGTPPDCDDGNPCTLDTCAEPGFCYRVPLPDGSACEDAVACSFADGCVAGACASAGSDLDASGTCDQDEAGSVSVVAAELKAQKVGNARGRATAKATFPTAPPFEAIDVAQPLTIAVRDLASNGAEVTFAPGECAAKGGTIRCRSGDRSANATFRGDGAVSAGIAMEAKFRGLAIDGPFAGPLTVALVLSSSPARFGSIAACAASGIAIRCR